MSKRNGGKFGEAVQVMYDNIDEPINLDDIAKKVGMSLASLKRLFQEAIDQSPGAFMRRLRMELAFRSLQSKEATVLETALASGFDDQSAFARRFKQSFGFSPSQAREKINIVRELECIELEEPVIVELDDMQLQCVTKVGLYFESAPKAWDALKEKLNETELSDDFPGVFIGLGHDNPHEGKVPEDQVRFSACVSHVDRDIEAERLNISGGSYARFRYLGKPNNLGLAYHYIFGKWLENSSQEINKQKPAFTVFGNMPKGLAEQKIMICVPIVYTVN